jgi:hypothetical protein
MPNLTCTRVCVCGWAHWHWHNMKWREIKRAWSFIISIRLFITMSLWSSFQDRRYNSCICGTLLLFVKINEKMISLTRVRCWDFFHFNPRDISKDLLYMPHSGDKWCGWCAPNKAERQSSPGQARAHDSRVETWSIKLGREGVACVRTSHFPTPP